MRRTKLEPKTRTENGIIKDKFRHLGKTRKAAKEGNSETGGIVKKRKHIQYERCGPKRSVRVTMPRRIHETASKRTEKSLA